MQDAIDAAIQNKIDEILYSIRELGATRDEAIDQARQHCVLGPRSWEIIIAAIDVDAHLRMRHEQP